ncbi:unnamed protein product [Arctia plantaginis]|nr:unnamed protein product [Arctia plantaginis]
MFYCVKKVDISSLKHVCNNIIKVLRKQAPLHKESALCSRFLYKYDRKFSNDIGYRNFRKVHTALKKYLALNFLKDIENFLLALPSEDDDEKYLPTRQMLEYLMLRIITFSKIMLRICICSKQSAIFYLNRLKRGESHWMSLLPYALLSRLWSMTMVLVQHSTSWYSNLYPYLNILEFKGVNLLPDNYELPQDLEQWLDLKNVDNFGRFNWDQKKLIEDNILLDDDENDLFDSILNFVNQLNKNEAEEEVGEELKPLINKCKDELNNMGTATAIDYSKLSDNSVGINEGEVINRKNYKSELGECLSRETFKMEQGEVLSRENFNVLVNAPNEIENNKFSHNGPDRIVKQEKQELTKLLKQKMEVTKATNIHNRHTHMKVTNSESLKEFLKIEEKYRNESNIQSLTCHLSLMQWHALKKALLKLCDNLTNRKIDKKFQRIWKEKCLEYK